MKRLIPALSVGFVLGVAAGGLGQWAAMRHFIRRGHDAARILEKMSSELLLNEPQKQAVKAVLDAKAEKMRALRAQGEGVHLAARAQIRAALGPEQQVKFDEIVAKREARRKRRLGVPR